MPAETFPSFQPVGDSALRIDFGSRIDLDTNRRVHAAAQLLSQGAPAGIGEAVPTYAAVLLHYDPLLLDLPAALAWARERVALAGARPAVTPRRVEIPTVYGGRFGPDLPFVAEQAGLSEAEVVRIHSSADYPVYMMGFTPGFPYLGGMDPAIAAPRLPTPRTYVPAGSVGIAGGQTGVYPLESPGGWRIIGRTPLALFQPDREPPALLAAGDLVRFVPIREEDLPDAARD